MDNLFLSFYQLINGEILFLLQIVLVIIAFEIILKGQITENVSIRLNVLTML